MALTQFDVDQQSQTARQAALNTAVNGFSQLNQEAKTKRAQALQDQQAALEYRKAGYDVSPEMIAQSRAEEPSGLSKFFGAKSPEKVDFFANRTAEHKAKVATEADDRKFKRKIDETDMLFKQQQLEKDAKYKDALILSMGADNQKKLAETEKLRQETIGGKQMSANDIAKFDEGNQIPTMLKDVKATLTSNAGEFGPVSGRLSAMNPWDEKAQTIESQFRTASQAFGKFMEGGVLRKEDEDKYRKMFPNQSDTPEVAKNKLINVERLLAQRQQSTIEALKGAGYNVNSINKNLSIPDAPGILTKSPRTGSWGNEAMAKDPAVIKEELKGLTREEKIRMLQGK